VHHSHGMWSPRPSAASACGAAWDTMMRWTFIGSKVFSKPPAPLWLLKRVLTSEAVGAAATDGVEGGNSSQFSEGAASLAS
jgi:hypothetical protein